ncbi:MAG: hypothetical protein JRH20_27145, partial [Deltaproteobacteria bacterium]|nr:hypothetical protein [Deltaproteobacteria bacterium]
MAVDASGNVYVTGYFAGTANLGGGDVTATGSSDVFITSFTSAGGHRWQKALGGTSSSAGLSVAVDGNGDVYVVGNYQGAANFGGGDVTALGSSDIFVTSFTAAGAHRWQKSLGGTSLDYCDSVAVSGSGNVYLVGDFMETADLGG